MSGGHFEYGQLWSLQDHADSEYRAIKEGKSCEDLNNDVLAEALAQIRSAAESLYDLTKAADYYICGDIGEDQLRKALANYLRYDPFPKNKETPS